MIVIFSVQPEKGSPRIQVSKDVVYLGQDAEVGGLSSSVFYKIFIRSIDIVTRIISSRLSMINIDIDTMATD